MMQTVVEHQSINGMMNPRQITQQWLGYQIAEACATIMRNVLDLYFVSQNLMESQIFVDFGRVVL